MGLFMKTVYALWFETQNRYLFCLSRC